MASCVAPHFKQTMTSEKNKNGRNIDILQSRNMDADLCHEIADVF